MNPDAAAIELRGVTRLFGERAALQTLDLRIERGEVFGLLGPNGSGKTTTLRILATLIKPTLGSASVLGLDVVAEAMAVRHNLGVMPEKPSLYERQSVRDNLIFWADAHGISDTRTAIARALEFTGLAGREAERVGQLSKGWRQRVALARAIVHRPPVLLLDEPSSGLDPSAAAAMERMIRELASDGVTVLMNTHRLAEAGRLCGRVAILRHGQLLELGTPAQIRARLLGNAVHVELAGAPTVEVRRAAESIAGLRTIRWEPHGFECRLSDATRDTPELVRRVVSAGGAVMAVVQEGDLEQAYLELMARTDAPLELAA